MILAIDPGNKQTALVFLEDGNPRHSLLVPNEIAMEHVRAGLYRHIVCEMVACYGMPVGSEVFDTCLMVGRIQEASVRDCNLVFRKDVKMHLCGRANAKDTNIRQALIDRYGPGKEVAIGTKKAPGPLYDLRKDMWAALAVGVTWMDVNGGAP